MCVHVKTKNDDVDKIINKDLIMVLECDQQAKEEGIKCVREIRSDNIFCAGNVVLQCGKEMLKKHF